jgi:NAD(P)-dependent dehydrogenase (short-subunit alcohol dehydrogenase family)
MAGRSLLRLPRPREVAAGQARRYNPRPRFPGIDPMQVSDVRAVITGGVSGLGLAVARIWSRTAPRSRCSTSTTTRARPPWPNSGEATRATSAPTSPTRPACRPTLAAARDFLGGLNAAINCAGILGAGRVLGKEGAMPLSQFAGHGDGEPGRQLQRGQGRRRTMQHNAPGEDGERGVIINTASSPRTKARSVRPRIRPPRAAWSA